MLSDLHTETKEDLKKIGVYTITNLINGKMYVGSTNNSFYERWRKHLKDLNANKHHSNKLQNSVNKHGVNNFKFEILEITEKEHTTSIERYWFNVLNPVVLGYNISHSTNGGCLGCKITDEHRLIISQANKNNMHFLNHKHEESVKAQIKESTKDFFKQDNEKVRELKKQRRLLVINLNKTVLNIQRKKPVTQIDLISNEPIKEWDSASDVGKAFGVSPTSITKVCKGKSEYAYGFKWSYKDK
jgi:group I intron endonuclease